MARAARRVGGAAVVLLLAVGAYGTADAYDVVPGVVTLAPVPPEPEPFPTAPGAVPGPEPTAPLGPLDPGAPVPDGAQVAAIVEAALADPRLGPSSAVMIADLVTGEVLAEVAADAPRVPASTAKLLTAAAALTALGPDTTLPTRVVKGSGDQVVLVGGGDIMLGVGPGDPSAINGRAGITDLATDVARQLRLAGQTTVRIGVDDSLLSGPAASPTWRPADIPSGFVAPVASVAINIAKVRDEDYPPRHADPAAHAAQVLADELGRLGITVEGRPTRVAAGADATQLAEVASAPVRDLVAYMLQTSDNTVAEILGRLVAVEAGLPGSFDGATQAVVRQVQSLGVDTTGVTLVDCSGLGEGSAVPVTVLTEVLRLGRTATDPVQVAAAVDLLRTLPIAGMQGTLTDRYLASSARGLVRAKTGSLTGVTSLAGTVVTADGRMLVFAVVADQTPPGGQLGPRAVIDGLVSRLAECGCSAAG